MPSDHPPHRNPADRSAREVLREVRSRFPETPFLALGQTIWWDEPMKAVLRVLLDAERLGGHMVLGVHDTDYFAKTHAQVPGDRRYELLSHNDGATKDLWSAAGEISALFGSETIPARHALTRYGVPFHQLARARGPGRQAFIDDATAAWGWRGLVYTGSADTVVKEVRLQDVAPGIRRMLEWGFGCTTDAIETPEIAEQARRTASELVNVCCECCRACPDGTLTDLYQHVYPHLYALLMQRPMTDHSVTSTSQLLRFGPDTAHLPRFEFIDLFLRPETRRAAADAYNGAVAGSEVYALGKFGLGALPFDLVVPGRGRGTLRVTLRAIHIETRDPIRLRLERPIASVMDLAQALSAALGPDLVLVGKAVALISMLAREFIFVFNEAGSTYVHRTRAMNDALAALGLDIRVHPMLRLHYQTWDAATEAPAAVALPEPFRDAFGAQALPMSAIGASWRKVISEQQQLLETLSGIQGPRALIRFLDQREPGRWGRVRRTYDELSSRLAAIREQALPLELEVRRLYTELAGLRAEIAAEEARKGAHFRRVAGETPALRTSVAQWGTEDEDERARLTRSVESLLRARGACAAEIGRLKARRLSIERSPEVTEIRARMAEVRTQAEMARLRIVRNALLVTRGMPQTDHRPAAWWLPFVDPSGRWFSRIVETTQAYVEPLLTGPG